MRPKSHLRNKSVVDRAKQYKDCRLDDDNLFCSVCEKVLDYQRKSTVESHMKFDKHIVQKRKLEDQEKLATKNDKPPAKKLHHETIVRTVAAAETAKQCRDIVASDFLLAMLAANIPIEKADNPTVRDFFVKHVCNGSSIAGSKALDENVPVLYEKHKQFLINIFAGSQVYVILDETSDDRAKQVLNILLATPVSSDKYLIKLYLADTVLFEKTNSATVGGALL